MQWLTWPHPSTSRQMIRTVGYFLASAAQAFVNLLLEIIGPAVNGTVGILASIKKNTSTVKRVVITSSVGSIIHEKQRPTSGYLLFDEVCMPLFCGTMTTR